MTTTTIMPGIRQVTQMPKRVYRRRGFPVDVTQIELYTFANGAESEARYREALELVGLLDAEIEYSHTIYEGKRYVHLGALVAAMSKPENLRSESEPGIGEIAPLFGQESALLSEVVCFDL